MARNISAAMLVALGLVVALSGGASAAGAAPILATNAGITEFVDCMLEPIAVPEWPVQMCVHPFIEDIID